MAKARRNRGKAPRSGSSAQRKVEQLRRQQRARTIRIWVLAGAGAVVVVVAAILAIVLAGGGGTATPTASPAAAALGPEGIAAETGPVLAPVSTSANGQTVDGIQCAAAEQTVYHIHTRLAVYVNGAARQIPAGIGVVEPSVSQTQNGPFVSATHCYYWLHTHAYDGIIHVESPTQRTYTLGNFFDIWRQPLSATQVGPATGTVTAFVNGAKYTGDPRGIPLGSRTAIQLSVGSPVVPFRPVDWSKSQL